MNRRRVLKGISTAMVIGTAGCINTTSTTDPLEKISSIKINTNIDEGISYTVDFIKIKTEESPIGFTVTFTNTLDETITVSDATDLLFEHNTDESNTFILLSESYSEASKSGNCWSVDPTQIEKDIKNVIEIQPGETITRDLYIVSYTNCSFKKPDVLTFSGTSYIHNTESISEGQILSTELIIE